MITLLRASWYALTLAVSLILPWRIPERARMLRRNGPAVTFAAINLLLAAGLATAMSSWTYMAGKGIFLGIDQMDLGADDLPPDTFAQVALGMLGAGLLWSVLLGLVFVVCVVVSDSVYLLDRTGFRVAVLSAALLTPWLVVGVIGLLAVNASILDEFFHPVEALRLYSRLRQTGWPATTLGVRDRVLLLATGFSIVWASTLASGGTIRRGEKPWVAGALAVVGCSVLWWALARALPWTIFVALAG